MKFNKQTLLVAICSFFNLATIAQTNSILVKNQSQTLRWNINESIWSHANQEHNVSNKPVLDYTAIDNWIGLSEQVSISPNGEYVVYGIRNNLKKRIDSVIVCSRVNNWIATLSSGAENGFFSSNNKQYIFQDKIGLCFLQTGKSDRKYEKVESYQVDEKKQWLAYRQTGPDSILVLLNLVTGIEKHYNDALSYDFDYTGTWFAYQKKDKQVVVHNLSSGKDVAFGDVADYAFDAFGTWIIGQSDDASKDMILYNLKNGKEQRFNDIVSYQFFKSTDGYVSADYLLLHTSVGLDYLNSKDGKRKTIWEKSDSNIVISGERFDKTGNQVLFVTTSGNEKAIWYWKVGMDRAEQKVNNQTKSIGKDVLVQNGVDFTDNGQYIQFTIQPTIKDTVKPKTGAIQIDVWSYQDSLMQSAQPNLKETITSTAILNLETNQIMLPEKEYEHLGQVKGDYALLKKSGDKIHGDRFWEKGYYEDSTWVLFLETRKRWLIPSKISYGITFSPNGEYLVYFDAAKKCNYYSYELATGKLINISAGVPNMQMGITTRTTPGFYLRTSERPSWSSGIKLWLENGNELFVYDDYGDIWQLDAAGKKAAICITNEYGKLHNISFNLLNRQGDDQSFIGKDTLLLSAFNRSTKWQGFFRKVIGAKGDPELLSMTPCYMQNLRDGTNGQLPIKAKDANVWVVNRQTDNEAPNFFVTSDFKTFQQLSNLQPQRNYNWLKAELHSFKQLDGTVSQGVLYKPENFDSSKKYPVMISFYGTLSDKQYHYPTPDYISAADIFNDPAWMVSHGYLVLIPDIYFIKNQWGPSTVNTINGAARYLSQLPYVDGEHIGAIGHSNSGRFGYYLLTHSSSFAAMSIGSGFTGTDVISLALSLSHADKKTSNLEFAEQHAFGTALGNMWENKERWADHTAVLQADKATAPLLLFHCDNDGDDPRAAVELYTAMRRLEKLTWWLNYNNGGHRVSKDDARDWTIRFTQFFDHYLKQAPAPRWMTQGIPKYLKGIEARYELDAAGSCAMAGKNHCYICEAWNKMYKRDTAMFTKPISEWKLDKDLQQELDKKTKTERASLDKQQLIEDKKIVDILKHGYKGDGKRKKEKINSRGPLRKAAGEQKSK